MNDSKTTVANFCSSVERAIPVVMTVSTGRELSITMARVEYFLGDVICSGVVALDSCCTYNIFAPGHAQMISSGKKYAASCYGGESVPLGSEATFSLLKENNGKPASINGATQIRAGVIRPEIVIPIDGGNLDNESESKMPEGIQEGSTVRVIRSPNFGKIGKVTSLPAELNKMESETMVRVAEINIEGKNILIPRANLEMVETE